MTGIEGLHKLRWLDRWENPLQDLKPLSTLVALRSLKLQRTSVQDLSPLAALTNLTELTLDSTLVKDVKAQQAKRPKLRIVGKDAAADGP